MPPSPQTDLLVLAGGSGKRIKASIPKQFLPLRGVPLIAHSLMEFERVLWIGKKIIVHPRDWETQTISILKEFGITNYTLVEGGNTRQESVANGLQYTTTDRIITHNAAVALVTTSHIERLKDSIDDCVTTATPLQHNLVAGDSWAQEPLPRTNLKVINSPQSFDRKVITHCHNLAHNEGIQTQSDAELLLNYGYKVRLVEGDARIFKITTPIDFALAELFLTKPNDLIGAPSNSHEHSYVNRIHTNPTTK